MKNSSLYNTLVKQIYTEKSVTIAENNSVFVFKVHVKSNKKIIKNIVEKLFKVSVKKVRTLNIKGSNTKFKQIPGKKSDWKKAFISLKKGYDINLANLK